MADIIETQANTGADLTVTPPQTNVNQKKVTFDGILDAGKGIVDKFGGKGILGAAGGVLASKILFKNSIFTTLAMGAGGFFIERTIFGKDKTAEIPAANAKEVTPDVAAIAEAIQSGVIPQASSPETVVAIPAANKPLTALDAYIAKSAVKVSLANNTSKQDIDSTPDPFGN
jgi:hypothetical protein